MTLAYSRPSSSSPYRMPASVDSADPARLGGAECKTADGRSLPLASATLRVKAGGGLARIVLEQTFENPYEDTLRVTYKMPLPVDGAVSSYAFRIGTRTITGKVDRKESARERFEAAILEGKTAALLEQQKADIFTQDIGNIPPKQSLVAEITIDQRLAWTAEGEWELRFPTVIGPRYLSAHVPAADAQASHIELADGGVHARVHLEVQVADAIIEGKSATSPSHRTIVRPDGVLELADLEGAKLDRDIVVRWPVAARAVGLSLLTARPEAGSPISRNAYALLSIVPPAPDAKHAALPRDLIVLLDTSGSMGGPPLAQAQRVVASLVDSLGEEDRLEIVEFSSRPRAWKSTPVFASQKEKSDAIAWVMKLTASGGTEMASAIGEALRGLRPGAQRQVVLVTDGYVGGEQQIVNMLHESMPASCRMHVVGVGSAANRNLAVSLARAGRGAEVLIGLEEDAERGARRLVDKTRAPVLTDLVIGGDALVEHAPEHVPDVFAGAPVLAALHVKAEGGELIVRGNLARGVWEQRIQVPATWAGEGNGAIVKLFAREQVADLEMRWTIGKQVEVIDREIESAGLVYQIATRRTSWLAIDDDNAVDPSRGYRHEEVPQELPYGTTMASFGAAPPPPMMMMGMAAPMGDAMRSRAAPAPAPMSFRGAAPPPRAALSRPAAGLPPPGAATPRSLPRPMTTPAPAPNPDKVYGDDDDDEATDAAMAVPAAPAAIAPRPPRAPVAAPPAVEPPVVEPPVVEPPPPLAPQQLAIATRVERAAEPAAKIREPAPAPKPRRRWLLALAALLFILALLVILAALARFLLH